MWPDDDASFEPSAYSPAGRIQQAAQVNANLQEDAAGVWRAVRRSWGARIIVGGIAIMVGISR